MFAERKSTTLVFPSCLFSLTERVQRHQSVCCRRIGSTREWAKAKLTPVPRWWTPSLSHGHRYGAQLHCKQFCQIRAFTNSYRVLEVWIFEAWMFSRTALKIKRLRCSHLSGPGDKECLLGSDNSPWYRVSQHYWTVCSSMQSWNTHLCLIDITMAKKVRSSLFYWFIGKKDLAS